MFRLGELFGGGLRSDMGGPIEGQADANAPRALGDPLEKGRIEGALHEQARAERAGLPGRTKRGLRGDDEGALEIGVGEDDMWRLAAAFESAALQIAGGERH